MLLTRLVIFCLFLLCSSAAQEMQECLLLSVERLLIAAGLSATAATANLSSSNDSGSDGFHSVKKCCQRCDDSKISDKSVVLSNRPDAPNITGTSCNGGGDRGLLKPTVSCDDQYSFTNQNPFTVHKKLPVSVNQMPASEYIHDFESFYEFCRKHQALDQTDSVQVKVKSEISSRISVPRRVSRRETSLKFSKRGSEPVGKLSTCCDSQSCSGASEIAADCSSSIGTSIHHDRAGRGDKVTTCVGCCKGGLLQQPGRYTDLIPSTTLPVCPFDQTDDTGGTDISRSREGAQAGGIFQGMMEAAAVSVYPFFSNTSLPHFTPFSSLSSNGGATGSTEPMSNMTTSDKASV